MSDVLEDPWTKHETDVGDERLDEALANAGPEQVVCRECARAFGQITEQHLRTHDMSLEEYRTTHPSAPIYPDAPDRQPGREPGFSHEAETKQKIAETTEQNHGRGIYE